MDGRVTLPSTFSQAMVDSLDKAPMKRLLNTAHQALTNRTLFCWYLNKKTLRYGTEVLLKKRQTKLQIMV